MRAIGILLLCFMSNISFTEGKTWQNPPNVGELFMVTARAPCPSFDDPNLYIIGRYQGSNPYFEEQFNEWNEVTSDLLYEWINSGKRVVNIAEPL